MALREVVLDPHVLRAKFLSFFQGLGHEVVTSSPVVPKGDPTLLFANAGMNQFKDVFLGAEVRSYKRAASAQKCIRAGGKHNDLDEVGKDGRHLTFFEMLGNWSFGDYYKRESIQWGWSFLTEVLGLPVERLYVTVYKDDDASWDIWANEVGVPTARMMRLGDIAVGDEENFWSMGPVGPCGPCTEIHFDTQPHEASTWGPGCSGERYVEIWNHVFMEFDRDAAGVLTSLPMKSVDTGMGLERVAALLAGVESVYATALFKGILEQTASLLGRPQCQAEILAGADVNAFRVIADHVRTLTFAVSEGQPFSNEGRGYVLRRILRRAVRFGRDLGFREPFLCKLSQAVVDEFAGVYPELAAVSVQCQEVLRLEEERFFRTLERGLVRFEEVAGRSAGGRVAGQDAFVLYDTFGFPLDLTQIMAEERGLEVDVAGFEEALSQQRQRSSEASGFTGQEGGPWIGIREGSATTFLGYARHSTASQVIRYRERGDFYDVLLDMTPFYAEGGGQVGDGGLIHSEDGQLRLRVLDTQRTDGGIVHVCRLEDGFVTRESMAKDVIAEVNAERRGLIASNHTATHLLHKALRAVVSTEIFQAGSLVRDDKFRFDFSFSRALTEDELERVEQWVNAQIRAGHEVRKHVDVPHQTAQEWGAMAIFGEKYGDRVRVVEVPGVSMELCGGIHVENTREILLFRIVSEGAIAAGTRRIEAVTNAGAFAAAQQDRRLLRASAEAVGVDTVEALPVRLKKWVSERAELERQVESLTRRVARTEVAAILREGKEVGGVRAYAARVQVRERKDLLLYVDLLRERMGEGVALLGAEIDGRPALVCAVSEGVAKQSTWHATAIVNACAQVIGGRGGGRPTLAQAGGAELGRLDEAIAALFGVLQTMATGGGR